jgi:Zn-dependent protease
MLHDEDRGHWHIGALARRRRGAMNEPNLVIGLLWFIAFLFSTTVHEAMHAYVAWKGGDLTAYEGGQVSLSPLPHIRREPIGMLVVPLVTALGQGWAIGWASAPYDPYWAARHPGRAAAMSAAGPAGNLAIALLAFVALKAGLASGMFVAPEMIRFEHLVGAPDGGSTLLGTLLSIFLVLNVLLFAFNLLPLPPLDGGAILEYFLPRHLAERLGQLSRTPMFQIIGLVVAWQVFPAIARPLVRLVLAALHSDVSYS